MRRWGWLLVAVAGCGDPDRDYAGFADGDDCAPDDPFVYPGAPDTPADGIDSDCDGVDPDPAYVGDWEVVTFSAMYSTFDAFAPDSAAGTMSITADGSAALDGTAMLDETLVGFSVPVVMSFEGSASATAQRGGVVLYLAGEVDATIQVEPSEIELDCSVDGELL
ncbi:MAG: putative metal-binding motif-containing protein, partial [Myxococcota bacterium]